MKVGRSVGDRIVFASFIEADAGGPVSYENEISADGRLTS